MITHRNLIKRIISIQFFFNFYYLSLTTCDETNYFKNFFFKFKYIAIKNWLF